MMRQKAVPVKRAGQTVVAANKRKRPQQHEDTPHPSTRMKTRLHQDAFGSMIVVEPEEIQPEFYDNIPKNNNNKYSTEEEAEFWEEDKLGEEAWIAEARRYKIPICMDCSSIRLSCPNTECIQKHFDMSPAYLRCKSKQGGQYVAMMFVCNYCNASTESRQDAQRNNIFAGHIVSRFAQNYIRRARECGIDDISTIPLPYGASEIQEIGNVLNQASKNLPTINVIEEMKTKLDEIHQIIIQEFGGKPRKEEEKVPELICEEEEDEFEKVEEKELEEVEGEEGEEPSASQNF